MLREGHIFNLYFVELMVKVVDNQQNDDEVKQ